MCFFFFLFFGGTKCRDLLVLFTQSNGGIFFIGILKNKHSSLRHVGTVHLVALQLGGQFEGKLADHGLFMSNLARALNTSKEMLQTVSSL